MLQSGANGLPGSTVDFGGIDWSRLVPDTLHYVKREPQETPHYTVQTKKIKSPLPTGVWQDIRSMKATAILDTGDVYIRMKESMWKNYLKHLEQCGVIPEVVPDTNVMAINTADLHKVPPLKFVFDEDGTTRGTFEIVDRKSTRLNSSHSGESRMPSSA